MDQIVYKPHCSKCGALISSEIAYTYFNQSVLPNLLRRVTVEIEPSVCPECGTWFDSIIIVPPREIKETEEQLLNS